MISERSMDIPLCVSQAFEPNLTGFFDWGTVQMTVGVKEAEPLKGLLELV